MYNCCQVEFKNVENLYFIKEKKSKRFKSTDSDISKTETDGLDEDFQTKKHRKSKQKASKESKHKSSMIENEILML